MTIENLVTRNVATVDLMAIAHDGAALKPVGIVTGRNLVVSILASDLAPGRISAVCGASVFDQHRWSTAPAICGASL